MLLKIITHERIVFEGEVDEMVIQTTSGQLGILKDHIPLTTTLDIGVTKTRTGKTGVILQLWAEYFSLKTMLQQY